ncbi:redoxin [Tenacibaculum todarodis]|uniref:Redoxin n=1 Tax=Tenacibaculum todarodis TaxID=1850252 RepID=A0A1L3JIY4_9FLAO|nr:TlpA disulfide reductase family protein [Tenacibaculum todarodis]APG65105.1 redoxin [Tenacibaculum todarodis]
MKKLIVLITLVFSSCNFETPTQFSEKANKDILYSLEDTPQTFKEVIDQYKGKKVLIDVWASWCADCVKGLPTVKELQTAFPEVVFLFLSVDKKSNSWKNGVRRFNIEGEHYNLPRGMKDGDFVDFLNANWIPRYVVVDEVGNISLFKATKASDKRIVKALENNTESI